MTDGKYKYDTDSEYNSNFLLNLLKILNVLTVTYHSLI